MYIINLTTGCKLKNRQNVKTSVFNKLDRILILINYSHIETCRRMSSINRESIFLILVIRYYC